MDHRQLQPGAAGTCSYNGATAPGTETLTSVAGFPATDGTQLALGSVTSTGAGGPIITCVLYQDVTIPAGATTATFSVDIGVKAGNDGGSFTAARVGIYSAASVPSFNNPPLVSTPILYEPAAADTMLNHQTSATNFNVSTLAGQTVRFVIMNAADFAGHEVIGVDNVQFLVNVPAPAPTPTSAIAPTLSEWATILLASLLVLMGLYALRRLDA